jgi:hypothetical protein
MLSAVTVNVAVELVVGPAPLLRTQRNWALLSDMATGLRVYLGLVAPEIFTPPRCHW